MEMDRQDAELRAGAVWRPRVIHLGRIALILLIFFTLRSNGSSVLSLLLFVVFLGSLVWAAWKASRLFPRDPT